MCAHVCVFMCTSSFRTGLIVRHSQTLGSAVTSGWSSDQHSGDLGQVS